MLYVLTSPAWAPPGQAPRPLPLTVPAALLVVLAAQPGWLARERLALVFWPDAAPTDALHHLRINLHRARQLLADWGLADALKTERGRVQLALPSDLAQLRAAQARGDAALLARLSPAQWLKGWQLPGYDGFAQWCDDTAQQLQADWLAASRRALPGGAGAPVDPLHPMAGQAADRAGIARAGGLSGGLSDSGAGGLPGQPGAGADADADAEAAPALSPLAAAQRLVPGREAQLQRLLASPAPALLLLGEPGAGKTSLLRAAYPQAPLLRGLEGLHAMPYRPLLDGLRQHTDTLARALRQTGHPLRPYRLDLARLLPELAPDEPLPPLDALTAQTRLVEALARAFEALTPVLLVDDLQWCDSASIDWLLMLAHSGRLRWRAAARRHELTPAQNLSLQGLRSAVRLEELDVPPLARDALARACAVRWPQQAFRAEQLDRLQALSGGNAFLLGELVAAGLADADGGAEAEADADADTGASTSASTSASASAANSAGAGPASLALDAQPQARRGAPVLEALPGPLVQRVARLVLARLGSLPPLPRQAVEAAAVFVQPMPSQALRHLVGLPAARDAVNAAAAAAASSVPPPDPDTAWSRACAQAVAAGLLQDDGGLLACRHDLIRQAVADALAPARRAALHRHAALWLADRPEADALVIAGHWRAAGEPQTALAWCHRGAEQLKSRGRFDQARALWHAVADDSLDATQSLRARLALAACDLFDDLTRGEAALRAVQAQLGAVADPQQHRLIEGQLLAALVDNRVFAGDIASACQHAERLRSLLPTLPEPDRIDAIEVLIELAMRQPDIPGAWALLAQLRQLAPRRPTLLSFEGQIHWFGGEVQAAHDALARLLARHPDYCRGITIENDLAVMLQALGRIDEAEAMARRSLANWAGVAHTETLSLLVLGLVLTSAGRHADADAALQRALALARDQASPGFEAEALVRRARLLLQCGRITDAQQALDRAAPLLAHSPEPLRVSQLVLAQVLTQVALTGNRPLSRTAPAPAVAVAPPLDAALARLQAVATRSHHPLVAVRLARVQAELALAAGDAAGALAAAEQQARQARQAGLLEPLAEAWLLQARAQQLAGQPPAQWQPLLQQAAELSARQGLADVHWRALAGLAALAPADAALAGQAHTALQALLGGLAEPLFDADAAARREPWLG